MAVANATVVLIANMPDGRRINLVNIKSYYALNSAVWFETNDSQTIIYTASSAANATNIVSQLDTLVNGGGTSGNITDAGGAGVSAKILPS
jgi:hypothetical protein